MRFAWIALVSVFSSGAMAEPAPPAAVAPEPGATFADTATILAWPLQLERSELMLLGVAAVGTVGLLRADTGLYRRLEGVRWTVRSRSIFDYTLHAGDGIVDLALMASFAFGDEQARRTSLAGVEALISAGATSVLLKHLFRVPRPQEGAGQKRYFRHFENDAFPSGHTMAAFATATVISKEYPGAAPYAYGAATLVGLSVMKRGWHWPSDVLAGAALGALIGRISVRVNQRRFTLSPTPGGIGLQADI